MGVLFLLDTPIGGRYDKQQRRTVGNKTRV